MRRVTFILTGLLIASIGLAQNVTEVTGIKFYEHHSSTINGGSGFGISANGSQSGYDFVQRRYYWSFDSASFGAYQNGEEANLDMVEHNGPYGNMGDFGFTTGTSSIWGGDISGNGTTQWVVAAPGFDYENLNDVSTISSAYQAGTPSNTISAVDSGAVYLGQIRDTNLYVAVKVTGLNNYEGTTNPTGQQLDVYFEFDYKYGRTTGMSLEENEQIEVRMYPNPADEQIRVSTEGHTLGSYKLIDLTGTKVLQGEWEEADNLLNVSEVNEGVYLLEVEISGGAQVTRRIVIQ